MTGEDVQRGYPVASMRQVRGAAAALIGSDRRGFAATVIAGVAAAVLGLAPPWLVGVIVNSLGESTDTASVDVLGAALVGLALVQGVLAGLSYFVTARFGQKAAHRLRAQMIQRILGLPSQVVNHGDGGDLMVRATTDVGRVTGVLGNAVPEILVAAVQVVLTFVFLILLSPILAGVTVGGMLGIAVVTRWYLRRATPAYLAQAGAYAKLAESLQSTIVGARTADMYELQAARRAEGDRLRSHARGATLRTLWLRSVLFPVVDSSYVVALVLVLLVGAGLYLGEIVELGTLVAALLYVRQVSGPFDTVLLSLESLQSGIASFARVEGLGKEVPTSDGATQEPRGTAIRIDAVRFAYDGGPEVIRGVTLDIEPGDSVAIVGGSGAGKSTLARLIAGLERPDAGTVTVGGAGSAALPPETARSLIALVTQEQYIFNNTVRTNVLVARRSADEAAIRRALKVVGADWVDDLPEGLDTVVGSAYGLSGAHAQQLALARVALADPAAVVLDEATSLLDPTSARQVERALGALLAGRTVIAIAHRLSTAEDARSIIVMDNGVVVETGTHEELLGRQGTYAELWRSWHPAP